MEQINTQLEDEQDDLFFWQIINLSNKCIDVKSSEYDTNEHLENLVELLSKNERDELIGFQKQLLTNLHKLYNAQIFELYMMLANDFKKEGDTVIFDDWYTSTDGFIYFRCWLLLKGKAFFDDISKDINTFISDKYSFDINDIDAEGLLYVADEAYSENNGNEDDAEIADAVDELYPNIPHYDDMNEEMDRIPKTGQELQKSYPLLVNAICTLRSK